MTSAMGYYFDVNKGDVKGQAVAKRALEIAIVGDHSIMLYGPRGAGKATLLSAYPEATKAIVRDSCACGNYDSVTKECICNAVRLARWCRRVTKDARDYDMIVEVPHLPAREFTTKPDPTLDSMVERRVQMAREFGKVHLSLDMNRDPGCYRTVELATRKLAFTLGDVERITSVARTIANLDHSEFLKAKHMAEAVQYRALRIVLGL